MKNLTFDLTERIRQIIEYYNLTPYSMSVKISVSEGTIRKFLAGQIGMKVETLTKILTIFDDISADWLILGKGEMLRENCRELPSEASPEAHSEDSSVLVVYLEKKIEDLQNDLAAANRTIGELQYRLSQEREKTNSASEWITSEPMSV